MNKSSIFYTITFIFILAIVSVVLAFLWLIAYDQQNYTDELNAKYSLVANARLLYFSGIIDEREFKEQTKNYKMEAVTDLAEMRQVIFRGEVLAKAFANNGIVEIVSYKRDIYLKIIYNSRLYLYVDQEYESYRYFIIRFMALSVVLILIFLYVYTIKKLRPLSLLRKQIDKFANNKLDEIEDVSSGKDEISQVASAFFTAITQIQKLNKSRQFFIRNIMHELKTPITKGLITLEMIDDSKYKERLSGIFYRLELLINEFAAVEQIASGATFVNKKKYNILDLIDEAKEVAMSDENNVKILNNESFFVSADFKLFSTAIKNMIDNGVKYADDRIIEIEINEKYLCFKNKGKGLDYSLEYYTQAFTQGNKQKDSFGLGLYIVDTILKSHTMFLDYEYENGVNKFYFKNLDKIIIKE